VHVLNGRVVAVLVRDKEGGLDVTAVGVLALLVEDLLVQVNVVVVDGVVKGDGDHLGNVLTVRAGGSNSAKASGDLGSILGTEAVGKLTDVGVASRSSVGVSVDLARVLIGSIAAVLGSVTEETSLDAVAIAASQVVLLADGLLGVEQRLDLLLSGLGVAVPDGGLPVAGLLLDIEGQTSWTTNGLETRSSALDDVSALVLSGLKPEPFSSTLVQAKLLLQILLVNVLALYPVLI
jgi:hypothetical protein